MERRMSPNLLFSLSGGDHRTWWVLNSWNKINDINPMVTSGYIFIFFFNRNKVVFVDRSANTLVRNTSMNLYLRMIFPKMAKMAEHFPSAWGNCAENHPHYLDISSDKSDLSHILYLTPHTSYFIPETSYQLHTITIIDNFIRSKHYNSLQGLGRDCKELATVLLSESGRVDTWKWFRLRT